MNRPLRNRQVSGITGPSEQAQSASRSLGEVDWLQRRRSLNVVDELDYALGQAHNARQSTPGTADILLTPADEPPQTTPVPRLPALSDIILHLVIQVSILGLSVLALIALWTHASRVFFILFLIWMIAFYVVFLSLAWIYQPQASILSTILYRLRNPPSIHPTPEKSLTPLSQFPLNGQPLPFQNAGPYLHQPPYRTATTDEYSYSPADPRSIEADDDDDIDEVTRQRMIEEEMDRREVSIVTVPKRKLWVANPS